MHAFQSSKLPNNFGTRSGNKVEISRVHSPLCDHHRAFILKVEFGVALKIFRVVYRVLCIADPGLNRRLANTPVKYNSNNKDSVVVPVMLFGIVLDNFNFN